jgi:hypothetical protein
MVTDLQPRPGKCTVSMISSASTSNHAVLSWDPVIWVVCLTKKKKKEKPHMHTYY